jgi:acetylornithine deacetylase/succinyl-diaminopimelate desuccinylase-like protein
MGFSVKKILFRGINVVSGKAAKIFHRPRKSAAPLADRLLVDALRMAELPSPAPEEEPRASFVLERLNQLGLVPAVAESGSVMVRLHAEHAPDAAPVLLFTSLNSKRWHSTESLSRLDAENAVGAGLSDSMGPAALLSAAENYAAGDFKPPRDLLLLFAVRSLEDPENDFSLIIDHPENRPFAAIGVRGLSLDRIIHSIGSWRLRITLSTETDEASNRLATTLIELARSLLGITWDGEGKTRLFIRRIEAGTGYGLTPSEGILEIELESVEGSLLELAMNAVKATAEKVGEASQIKTETAPLSFIPPGDSEKSGELFEKVRAIARDLRIKVSEENGADPASFFTAAGIPAISLGVALGKERAREDTIRIDSVEKGRRLLERLIVEAGT